MADDSAIVARFEQIRQARIAKQPVFPDRSAEVADAMRAKKLADDARIAKQAADDAKAAIDAQAAAETAKASQTAPAPVVQGANTGDVWYRLRMCESTNNYANRDTGHNGHYGAYQFSLSTWAGVGGTGNPADASPAEQDMRAQMLQARSGWGQWECKVN